MKGNRLIKNREYERDIIVSPNRGKTANLIWKHTDEFLCGVNVETARGLAYDLLKWAKTKANRKKNETL